MNDLYISRTLLCKDKTLTEAELVQHEGVAVVLAEPGAGKTRLLSAISSRLGVVAEKASIFRSKTSIPATNVLILDALDEVSKLDSSDIDAVLVKAQESGASKVVLASRSSEWEEARSVFIRDCFRTDPMVVRLKPFDDAEQKELFLDYKPGDYARIQKILDEGELYKAGDDHILGFLKEDGRLWCAAIKSTDDGSRLYLSSLHKARHRDMEQARKRWNRVDR